MSLFIQIIKNCLSPDNKLRVNSEQELLNYCDQNLFQTLSELCKLIEDNSTPGDIRLFCGTFIKLILSKDKYISIWNNFSQEQITFIKNYFLGNLASEKDDTKKTCSLAIAAIAKIEIHKGWNIIEIICNAAVHQNINYKITALITLQNLIDFLGDENLKSHEKQQILCSLTTDMSINENIQVINEAIIGYNKIIPFIEDNFKNEKERNFMINLLLNLLEPNYINKVSLSENIQKNILICFIDIAKKYTMYLQNNFANIANMTLRYFNCNNNLLSTLSIELWSTVCDYENEIKKNIISSNFQDSLNESIIRVIETRNNISFEESDEWTPKKAVVILLSSLVCLDNKIIINRMLNYISECLNNNLVIKFDNDIQSLSQNEKIKVLIYKENAFLIYRGILYSNKIDSNIILGSLQKIINELKNISTLPIGNYIAFCLAIICKFHFDLINESEKKFDDFIIQILQLLEFHMNNKKILNCLCLGFKYIIKNAHPDYFNKHLTNIISILLKIAYDKKSYNKDLNLTSTSMFLIGKIIEVCEPTIENKNIIQMFFSDLYNRFQNSLNPNNFSDKNEQICYQNCILSIITSCGGEFLKITMDINQITCVFNLIEQCLQQRGCIFEEGILALSSLAYFGSNLFSNISKGVMKYILFSLEERQNFQLCHQGLLAADDIIRCVGGENLGCIPQIVEKMRKIISDPEIPRGLKIKCFSLYSDIFMSEDKSIGDYLKEVLQLLVDGMNSSMDPPNSNIDPETFEYLNELREKIVELLTTVFLFLTNHNQTNVFSPYIDGFVKYLSKIVEPEFNSDIELIAQVCGLLGDLSNYFKSSIDLYFNQNSIKNMFDKLEKSNNPQHAEILNYAKQVLANITTNYD